MSSFCGPLFRVFDSIQQIEHEPDCRVVETQTRPQSLNACGVGHFGWVERHLSAGVAVGVEQSESHEFSCQIRVQASTFGEGVRRQSGTANQYVLSDRR